ncbi:unnamed protein product, partial [Owenia fusiformis]
MRQSTIFFVVLAAQVSSGTHRFKPINRTINDVSGLKSCLFRVEPKIRERSNGMTSMDNKEKALCCDPSDNPIDCTCVGIAFCSGYITGLKPSLIAPKGNNSRQNHRLDDEKIAEIQSNDHRSNKEVLS